MRTCDVAVVGAGIAGVACAYQLSLAGMRVALVDPNPVGTGGTGLGYGNLSIQPDSPAQMALTRYGLTLWEKLVEGLPKDCQYRRCGTLWIAADAGQMDMAERRCVSLNQQYIRAELWDTQQAVQAEPGLAGSAVGALFVADDGCLHAARAADFLFQLAAKKGAEHIRQRALSFLHHELKLDDGSVLHAGSVINAAGNDAASLTPDLPLLFTKQHILAVEAAAVTAVHHLSSIAVEPLHDTPGQMHFEMRQTAAEPGQSSQIWIGSSSQPVSESAASLQVEPRVIAQLLRRAIEMVPAIGSAKPLRSWTGICAAAFDGLPFIGRVSGREGLFVSTAYGVFGATAALASARLIADDILCQTSEIDSKPYAVNRLEGTKASYA